MVGVHQEGNEGRSDEEELLYLQLLTRSVGWGRYVLSSTLTRIKDIWKIFKREK